MEAAAQIGLLHYSESKLEGEQAPHIADAEENLAVIDGQHAVVVLDIADAAVGEDIGTPHHFVYTIPAWHWDSCTSE